MDTIKKIDVASIIDHTQLRADATHRDIAQLCDEAKRFRFASVCVNPRYVLFSARLLKGTGIKVCSVVGFPLGAATSEIKAAEARQALESGAAEIDMVLPVGAVKEGDFTSVLEDISRVRAATRGAVLKVILENAYLTDTEKTEACRLAEEAKADFVKTSTGFGPSGATVEDVRLMRRAVSPRVGVKAAGGIRTLADALKMIDAGAARIGTSWSVRIVTENKP